MKVGVFLLQFSSKKSQWAGWGTFDKNHKMFILIKLRFVNINICFFCFFLPYNNESHFVITKYCYTALYSHYCHSYFWKHHLIHDCYHILLPVSILLIILILFEYCCSVFLRKSVVNKCKEKKAPTCCLLMQSGIVQKFWKQILLKWHKCHTNTRLKIVWQNFNNILYISKVNCHSSLNKKSHLKIKIDF